MALSREKYKRVPDLYIPGRELLLRDGTLLWMQVLNPLERDEATRDAQVARARLVMALKSDHGSDERTRVQAAFMQDGRTGAIGRLVTVKLNSSIIDLVTAIRDDPDWKEKLEILERSTELLARAPEDAERLLLEQIQSDYLAEIDRRQSDERAYLTVRYNSWADDQLIEEYVDLYLDRRGGDVAIEEFNLTEIWLAARCCEGTPLDDGQFDHSLCERHVLRAWEDKDEVRALPDEVQDEMKALMAELSMTVRDAKNSHRQGSSSGSSPLPSAPEDSTRSIPTETHSEPLGTSSSPSVTASTS